MGLSQPAPPQEQNVIDAERESAKERENQELKERIKSLENGWSAVVSVLQASGLPLNISAPPTSTTTEPRSTSPFPVFVPQCPVLPISPALSSTPSSSLLDELESTRHLARVATIEGAQLTPMSLQRVVSQRSKDNKNSHHLQAPRRSITTQSLPLSMKWPWRNCYGRSSLPLLPVHQRRLHLMKFSCHLPRSTWQRPRRRR